MRSHALKKLNLTIFLVCFITMITAQAETTYAPKFSLRTGGGTFQNIKSSGGETSSMGDFNLVFNYFFTEDLSIAVGYRSEFDVTKSTMPIWGYDFGGRYYYYGSGTVRTSESTWVHSIKHDQMAFYVAGVYANRSYFLGQDPLGTNTKDQLEGTYATIDAATGVDYRISRHYEFNFEVSSSIMSFAASDSRVAIKSQLVSLGITYLF